MSESVYTEKYVLFLDILGFEAYTTSDEKSEEFARKVLQVLKDTISNLEKIGEKAKDEDLTFTHFSDTFVISSADFTTIVFCVGLLQTCILGVSLLSRGAMTYGKVFHNGSQFIGPAINRAYNLEKSQAIYPRVIIDSERFPADIITKHNLLPKKWPLVKIDFDGWQYIYCSGFCSEDYHFNQTYYDLYADILRKMHEKAKQDTKNYWKFKSKYIWFEKTYFGN